MPEALQDRIEVNPRIQHGKPVIRGTRVPVAAIVGGLARGMTFEQVQDDYGVSADDIRAAQAYASELIEEQEHHPVPA